MKSKYSERAIFALQTNQIHSNSIQSEYIYGELNWLVENYEYRIKNRPIKFPVSYYKHTNFMSTLKSI